MRVDGLLHDVDDRVLRLQDVVERVLAEHGAKRRQRHLLDGVGDAAHLDDRALRIDDAVPDHRVDLDRHIVAGDALLLLDGGGDGAQVELGLPLDEEPDEIEAGPGGAVEFAQAKDDGALVLLGDTDALEGYDEHQQNDDGFNDVGDGDGDRRTCPAS